MKLKNVSQNTYEFSIDADLTPEDIKELSKTFKEFEDRREKVNLLGVFESFPSLKALFPISETAKMKFSGLRILNKYAILADEDWINAIIPVANFFTPSIPVKAFGKNEREDALQWLQQPIDREYAPEEYLTGVEIEKVGERSYAMYLDNHKIDHGSMGALHSILDRLNPGEKMNLMMQFNKFPSIDSFQTFLEGLKVDLKIFGRLDKYAIVSDVQYIDTLSEVGDFLTPGIAVKAFGNSDIEVAKEWITN